MTAATAVPLSSPGRPQALLFDWDNTLVDSWATIHHALGVTLAAMGQPKWSLEETKARVRESLRDSFPRLFGARWEDARRLYLDTFRSIHLDMLRPLPGAEAMLRDLAAQGLWLGVVSNKTGPLLRREAEALGWRRYFGAIVGATDAAADKPDPAPVQLALAGSGLRPNGSVWLVGDTGIDMECAVNAGCLPVLLGPADPAAAEFARYRPAASFTDCAALQRSVRQP